MPPDAFGIGFLTSRLILGSISLVMKIFVLYTKGGFEIISE